MMPEIMICLYKFLIIPRYLMFIRKDNDNIIKLLSTNKFRLHTVEYMPDYIGIDRG